MEHWDTIGSFPQYSVSTKGRVRNDRTDRFMTLLRNQQGIINVGLVLDRVQYKRSVTLLVATTFVTEEHRDAFDTPINLDGDRSNNVVMNLTWRPRWFAIRYYQQFRRPKRFTRPIQNLATGECFNDTLEVSIRYGVLEQDLMVSILNHTDVWPTDYRFEHLAA